MTNQETLELALNALKCLFGLPDKFTDEGGDVAVWRLGGSYRAQEAIKALEEALKQEQVKMPPYLNASYEGDDLFTGDQVRELLAKQERRSVRALADSEHTGEPVGFCEVLTMDDVADIIVNAQSRTPPYEINYMTVMQLTEKAVLEKFK